MAKTLAEYYASMGMALPSLAERKKKYVGTVSGFQGTGEADDNNTLLSYLQGGGSSAPTGSTSTYQSSADDMNSLPPEMRGGARGLFLDDNGNYVDDETANKIGNITENALKYGVPMSELGDFESDPAYKIPAGYFNDNPYAGLTRAEAQAKYDADLKAGGYDSTGTKSTTNTGTGAITTRKKLTIGNESNLNPSSQTLAEILRKMVNPNADEIDNIVNQRVSKYKSESEKEIDENAIRKSFKDRIQGSIDAINQTYASMLGSARIRGENNKGVSRAINARSGLLGSDFALADEMNLNRANQDVENSIEAERLGLVQRLLMDAESKADTSIKDARKEKMDAMDKLMESITTRDTRSAGKASKLAQYLVVSGVKSADEITDSDLATIRDTYGVDPATFMSEFDKARTARDTLENTLNKDRYKTISDGTQLYDTQTGKIIENTKNFAPTKGGLSSVLGGTGVTDVYDAMERIANIESKGSGDYQAVGPLTAKGQRAYGRYQVMDFNIPVWTKEVLGKSMTPQEFLNNPQAQDAVAQAKLQEAYDKYGSWEDSASVWFSGRPLSGNTSKDVLGTSTPAYVQKFLGGSNGGISPEAQSYIDAVKSGRRTEKEVLDTLGSSATLEPIRRQVMAGLNSQAKDSLGDEKTRQTLTTIDQTIADLEKNKNLAGTFRTRNANNGWLNWSANQNTAFVNTVDKLTGQLLRLDGVTLKAIFGPQISNADASTIKEIIGNALDPRNQTPEAFQQSLDDIKRGLETSKNQYAYTGSEVDNGAEYNYERDLASANDAISRGADPTQVWSRFNAKYAK